MLKKTLCAALIVALAAFFPIAATAAESYGAETPLNAVGDKLTNISLAVEAIDGMLVPGGERFSFNEAVGPRVEWRGFRRAPNGRGATVTGGGVAQVATTLYLALRQMDDIEFGPLRSYGSRFADDYVSNPEYALVTDYDAGIDLSFTNLGDDLAIDLWLEDDRVCCAIRVGEGGADDFWTDAGEDDGGNDAFPPVARPAGDAALKASASLDCGDDPDVRHNAALAADCVNDTTLNTRDVFSFNDIVGPRTRKYGYVRAANGRGAKVTGGGVAQVASALWLAVKDWDAVAVVEKSTYGEQYSQHYVESSADAILTDYASGRDFSFRYTGPGSVTIYTWVEDGRLYCRIYEN